MSAWGSDPFDNDNAADWVYELDGHGPEVVDAALAGDADGQEALAAAAIVARAHEIDVALSEEVEEWLSDQRTDVLKALAPQAVAALDRVLAGSELAELWAESGDDSWAEETRALRDALAGVR